LTIKQWQILTEEKLKMSTWKNSGEGIAADCSNLECIRTIHPTNDLDVSLFLEDMIALFDYSEEENVMAITSVDPNTEG